MSKRVKESAARLTEGPAGRLAEAFAGAGRSIYLVGGSVRDLFLGKEVTDLDFTTDARPDEIERLLDPMGPIWLAGKEFGTVGAEIDGHRVEVTTFRAEVYPDESRKPAVSFGDSLEDDLARRDFTVNAMAFSLPGLELIDPYGGIQDLHDALLRTPLDPELAFGDDPLRMLRAARFVSQTGFRVHEGAIDAIGRMRTRLGIVSAERIRDEMSKLLVGAGVGRGLEMIVDTGLAEEFIPELPALRLEQDPLNRHKDVLAHTIAVVSKTSPRLVLRLAALFHDVGKPKTRSFEGGKVSFHHHEVVGARMATERLKALRYPAAVVRDGSELVFLHLRFHTYSMGWTDRAVRRYVRDAGPLLDDLNELVRCDCTSQNAKKAAALEKRMEELETRIAELAEKEELASLRPALDGNQVMAHLGLAPGRIVGEALDFLMEIRLDEGEISEAEAYRRLDSWATDRGIEPERS